MPTDFFAPSSLGKLVAVNALLSFGKGRERERIPILGSFRRKPIFPILE